MYRFLHLHPFRAALFGGTTLVFGLVFGLLGAAGQSGPAGKAPDRAHIEEVLAGLNRGRSVGQVAVSPDGKRLAWVQGHGEGGEILVAPLDDLSKSERLRRRPSRTSIAGKARWPGRRTAKALAFFSDCAAAGRAGATFICRAGRQPARRLTELKGYVRSRHFRRMGRGWLSYMLKAQRGRPERWRR